MSNIKKEELPRLAIFGAGGLGIEMLKLLEKRPVANTVAILDKTGYLYSDSGLNTQAIAKELEVSKSINSLNNCIPTQTNAIQEFLSIYSQKVDVIFMALPNLPNTFIPELVEYIAGSTEFGGVLIDALKRTSAVQQLHNLDAKLKQANILYLSGCGATPGLLTTAAALASQSFVEIESVKITFGVGIANWQAYRATIREDIAHMPNYNTDIANNMTEEEIDILLDQTNGILELVNMEHADDIMLELAGICSADKVTVGGIVDTRNPQKPISTNVQVTGITYQNKRSTHTFTLGDETTMAANVNGTVLGFMNTGVKMKKDFNLAGFHTSADFLPRFAPVAVHSLVAHG